MCSCLSNKFHLLTSNTEWKIYMGGSTMLGPTEGIDIIDGQTHDTRRDSTYWAQLAGGTRPMRVCWAPVES